MIERVFVFCAGFYLRVSHVPDEFVADAECLHYLLVSLKVDTSV